ncbi:MAG: alkaline phosphatase [Planctomycetaceae bacterium]
MFDVSKISEAVKYEGGFSRRLFLAYGAALSSIPFVAARAEGPVVRRPKTDGDPFTCGVASGEPDHESVALWTRLAPRPKEGGGMPREAVEVQWEVAEDDAMKNVVQKGTTFATPQLAHSVHVEVNGLKPDRWYWYRFRIANAESPVGRTRTMPHPHTLPEKLKFAFASCQHFEGGFFTCYQHMAKDELDLVIHLGDYIYEGPGRGEEPRRHVGPKLQTLADYRNRHGQYHSDPLLVAMHQQCPWLVTWDDHEVENDYANHISQDKGMDPVKFLEQRANAYQAYYEHMPLRRMSVPHGPDMKIYRTINFGRLASFQVLDTRQYRTDQPEETELTGEVVSPKNTILGSKQAKWLKGALLRSPATWNVIAQQVLMAMVGREFEGVRRYSMDKWTGYVHDRISLVKFMEERQVSNPVVLTGDIHSSWVNDLRVDDRKLDEPVVATEFVGTALSSNGNAGPETEGLEDLLLANPHVKFHNRQSGYVRCTITPEEWRTDFPVCAEIVKPNGPVRIAGSYVVEAGKPGAMPV